MSGLPDELWTRILELGIQTSTLTYRDLCSLSISSARLYKLSNQHFLWSALLSSDFPSTNPNPSSFSKSFYKSRFEKVRAQKQLAHHRALLRLESHIADQSSLLQKIQTLKENESHKLKSTLDHLSILHKARQASVALKVWQPEIIRGRQKQIVEQCDVPIEAQINDLEMEVKLCRQQIAGTEKAYRERKRKLDAANDQLVSMKYHPMRDYTSTSSIRADECKKKKPKRSLNDNCSDFVVGYHSGCRSWNDAR